MKLYKLLLFVAFVFSECHVALSQNQVDSIRTKLASATNDTAQVELLLNLGFYYETEQHDSAVAIYKRAFALAEKCNHTLGKAKSAQYVGIMWTESGRYLQAIGSYEKALKFYNEAGDEKGATYTHNNMGNTYIYIADYRSSIEHFLKAKPFLEKQGDDYALAVLYGNLGECYRQLGDYTEMLITSRLSFHHAQKLDDKTEIANAGISLGTALSLNNQTDSGIYYLQQSLDLGKELNDVSIQFYALHDLADHDIKNNLAQEALMKADTCLLMAETWNRSYAIVSAHLIRGRALELNKKTGKQALTEFELALELARKEHALELERETLDYLAKHFERTSKFSDALRVRNEWIAVNDSIFSETKSRQIAELRTMYETSEKEKQLAEEKIRSAEKDEKLKKKDVMLYAAAVGVLFILLIAFLIIRSLRHRKILAEKNALLEKEKAIVLEKEQEIFKKEQQILKKEQEGLKKEQEAVKLRSLIEGQENERQRLGRELHDGLGGMLTAARIQLDQLVKESGQNIPVDKYMSLQNLISRAGTEMRQMSHDLAPEGLDKLGLPEALQQYCARISQDDLPVEFELHGKPFALHNTTEATLFRAVQEILNNTMKHAKASAAFVTLSYRPNQLTVIVEDNGKGFDVKNEVGKGKGLQGIVSRITYLKGELDVVSSLGKGTSYNIIVKK